MQTNKFLEVTQPWNLVKDTDNPKAKLLLDQTIYLAAENLRLSGILLQPFMPEKAAQLLDILGVSEKRRTLRDARPFVDFDYGTPFVALGRGAWDALFPPLEDQ